MNAKTLESAKAKLYEAKQRVSVAMRGPDMSEVLTLLDEAIEMIDPTEEEKDG